MNMTKDEINKIIKQCDELLIQRDATLQERDAALHERDAALHERDAALHERDAALQKRDAALQEKDKALQERDVALMEKDILKHENDLLQEIITNDNLNHQRDKENWSKDLRDGLKKIENLKKDNTNISQEYDQIMRERDNVLKDNEKILNDLLIVENKNKILEKDVRFYVDEIQKLKLGIETLKYELSSVIQDRDEALENSNEYQKRFGEITATNECRREYKSLLYYDINRASEVQNGSREQIALDLSNSCKNKLMGYLYQANQEIECLKKLADQYYDELCISLEEAIVSRKCCIWAFRDQNKVISEYESIRTLYDDLRKQCDDVVSKLTHIIKDLDMEQKNECASELENHKEKTDEKLKKEDCLLQLQATNHYSLDSAVDIHDGDTEILNIDVDFLGSNGDLDIGLLGGKDEPLYPNDNAIYISSINKSSLAARKLRVNDCILRVNNLDCSLVNKQLVLETMRALNRATLAIRRKKLASQSNLFTTQLQVNNNDHGISLEIGIYINKITPGSLVAKEGNLNVGDRVLSINNISMDNIKNLKDAMLLLNESSNVPNISTINSTYCAGYCSSRCSNRDVFKKYTNSTSQTDKYMYSIYQESHQKVEYIQPRRVMLGVPERPLRNLSLINNDISEHDKEKENSPLIV